MKKIILLLTFIGIGTFVSCSKEDAAKGGESLTVTPDLAVHYTGESFKFTVKSSDGTDVSSQSKILVDDVEIVGDTYASKAVGSHTVKATYSGITTKAIEINFSENPVALTSISTIPNLTSIITGDKVIFDVKGNNDSNFSQTSTIFVNNVAITGNTYTATASGTVEVYSTYVTADNVTVTSTPVQVTVNDPINFTKRVLIEDYTGTWCGYCPRVAFAIEKVIAQTPNAVPVAIHVSGGSSAIDPYNFDDAMTLANAFSVAGFPTAKLNRKITWSANEPDHVKQVVDLTSGTNPRVGLAMTTSISGTTATVDVKVKFGQNFSGLKLVVYAVEDKLVADQHNYTNYYDGADIIKDFTFNDVVRASLGTNIMGDLISGSTNVNDEFMKSFTYTIPANVKAENLHFVAFVVDSYNKALNVRNASNTETQTFEIKE